MKSPTGILLIDKPTGWTSFDVVAKCRNLLKAATSHRVKVGHSGTLDPMATGLLILLVGKATKQAEHWRKMPKTYETTIVLGATSNTDDADGELDMKMVDEPANLAVKETLHDFLGDSFQRPPDFSAVKVNGSRAYSRARKGEVFNLKMRPIRIHSIDNIAYEWPTLSFRLKVSSGTYVRALARDIGETLNTGAYLSALRRISIGNISLSDATSVIDLHKDNIVSRLVPLDNMG